MIKRVAALAVTVILAGATGAEAGLLGVGITAYGGLNIPIAQDDGESGTVFGARVPFQMTSALRLEPWFGAAKNGEYTVTGSISGPQTFDGGEITTFGLNALLGSPLTAPGFSIAFVGGIGSHQYEAGGIESDSRIGFNVGVDMGIGLGAMPLSLSGRAEAVVIPLDGGGSRKNAFITAGLTYKFGI
jgi:hypothetical protein